MSSYTSFPLALQPLAYCNERCGEQSSTLVVWRDMKRFLNAITGEYATNMLYVVYKLDYTWQSQIWGMLGKNKDKKFLIKVLSTLNELNIVNRVPKEISEVEKLFALEERRLAGVQTFNGDLIQEVYCIEPGLRDFFEAHFKVNIRDVDDDVQTKVDHILRDRAKMLARIQEELNRPAQPLYRRSNYVVRSGCFNHPDRDRVLGGYCAECAEKLPPELVAKLRQSMLERGVIV